MRKYPTNRLRRSVPVTGTLLLAALALALLAGGAGGSGGSGYQVRAIFDNAAFIVKGEQVKVAGVSVGKISNLDVTRDKKAAITLDISQPGFASFRQDAHCIIRPQSLIGEQFVECTPTQPKAPGQKKAPELSVVGAGRPGAGQHLLPVETKYGGGTSSPVGLDLITDTLRLPYRQRLALVINELGTGVAGNTTELRQVIRRANPALAQLDRVLAILARENRTLSRLTVDGDRTLTPLARDKARVSSFVVRAGEVAGATAARRGDLERNLQKLPRFLLELRPTARRLGSFADQATPVLSDLHAQAPALNRLITDLGPFANASRPAFRGLGRAARIGGPALVRSRPQARRLTRLGNVLQPVARNARLLLRSFFDTGGVEKAMEYLFYQTTSVNGYDPLGHYLRAELLSGGVSTCQFYRGGPQSTDADPSCSARFGNSTGLATGSTASTASVRRARAMSTKERIQALTKGLEGIGYRKATAPAPSLSGFRSAPGASTPSTPGNDAGPLLDYLLGGSK